MKDEEMLKKKLLEKHPSPTRNQTRRFLKNELGRWPTRDEVNDIFFGIIVDGL